jgi:hypothetical protein
LKLLKHYDIDWINDIKLPLMILNNTLKYLSKDNYYSRYKALILIGFISGLRTEELYKLPTEDINLSNRIVYV